MRRAHDQTTILKAFQTIPGVGPSIAQDLWDLGLRSPRHLKGKSPERLYGDFCRLKGRHIDRCLLYTFRCAVYFVSHERHDPRLLKWWNWSDEKQNTGIRRQKSENTRKS